MNKKLEVVVKEKCERFAKEYWNMEFNLPIKFSGRLTSCLGRYSARGIKALGIHIPVEVTFANKLFEYYTEEDVDGVIKHELTHWALGVQHKSNEDGHPVFENELRRIDAPSTRKLPLFGTMHKVNCSCCGKTVVTRKREHDAKRYCETLRYKSSCCKEMLVYGGILEKGDKSQGFLASIMNKKVEIPKTVETPKTKKVINKKTNKEELKEVAIKPAERVKKVFSQVMQDITKKQLSNLTNVEFCEKTFGLKYSFLKELKNDNDRKVNGHNRYYAGTVTIFGKQYIMCNDLYAKTAEKFEAWVNA